MSILSNDDLEKVNQYVKKLVRKTDSEFVLLTAKERKELIRTEKELAFDSGFGDYIKEKYESEDIKMSKEELIKFFK